MLPNLNISELEDLKSILSYMTYAKPEAIMIGIAIYKRSKQLKK